MTFLQSLFFAVVLVLFSIIVMGFMLFVIKIVDKIESSFLKGFALVSVLVLLFALFLYYISNY